MPGWIIWLAAIGVLGNAFASYGNEFFAPLISLIVAVYLGCALVLFGVYPLLLRFVGDAAAVPPGRGEPRGCRVATASFAVPHGHQRRRPGHRAGPGGPRTGLLDDDTAAEEPDREKEKVDA